MSIVVINRLVRRGKRWPHKHKWIPLRDHPRGSDVIVCFMMEDDEPDKVEMCSKCSARRAIKPKHADRRGLI